jgi:DNA polymerase-3 subunit delta'
MIMSLACENRQDAGHPLPCGACPTCRKIAAGNCPDILYVSRESGKATLGVDAVRALRESVSVLPNDLDFKIYVIEDAHTMTVQAQNALLLTLEEPPAFVRFLLLASEADALLETIRSRAPILRMQPVEEGELSAYLLDGAAPALARAASALKAADAGEYAALLRMAGGRIGRALELLEHKKRAPMLARRADATRVCELLASGTGSDRLLTHLLAFGKARDEVSARLALVQEALRDLIALGHSESAPLIFFTDREQAAELAATFTARALYAYVAATTEAQTALAANANVRLALTQYFCRLTA